jgi:ABC-2 type transport system ATP-binding protein
MSHEAEFLVLDEPTTGLDVMAREEILDLLHTYMQNDNHSILISSHISSDLESLCDDIYLIENGKIILHEETHTLLDEYAVLKVTPEQYQNLDKKHLISVKKETFGYSCLTKEKQFYQENYKEITMEKGSIDGIYSVLVQGKAVN